MRILLICTLLAATAYPQAIPHLEKRGEATQLIVDGKPFLALSGEFVMAPAARARKPDGPLAALKWVLRDTRFATTIPSMTDMEQLDMNIRAMAEPLERRSGN